MIVLKEVEGYSVEEISEALNMNPNTVKVRMFRARRRLSELYRRRYGQRSAAVGTRPPAKAGSSAGAGDSRAPVYERT